LVERRGSIVYSSALWVSKHRTWESRVLPWISSSRSWQQEQRLFCY
jgi:hypothetical protein